MPAAARPLHASPKDAASSSDDSPEVALAVLGGAGGVGGSRHLRPAHVPSGRQLVSSSAQGLQVSPLRAGPASGAAAVLIRPAAAASGTGVIGLPSGQTGDGVASSVPQPALAQTGRLDHPAVGDQPSPALLAAMKVSSVDQDATVSISDGAVLQDTGAGDVDRDGDGDADTEDNRGVINGPAGDETVDLDLTPSNGSEADNAMDEDESDDGNDTSTRHQINAAASDRSPLLKLLEKQPDSPPLVPTPAGAGSRRPSRAVAVIAPGAEGHVAVADQRQQPVPHPAELRRGSRGVVDYSVADIAAACGAAVAPSFTTAAVLVQPRRNSSGVVPQPQQPATATGDAGGTASGTGAINLKKRSGLRVPGAAVHLQNFGPSSLNSTVISPPSTTQGAAIAALDGPRDTGLINHASPAPVYTDDGANSSDELPPIYWSRGQVIGEGAYGRVFMGLNTVTGEIMAAKQIKIASLNAPETRRFIDKLQREIRLLQRLSHPLIVRYLGAQVERDADDQTGQSHCMYIFLEYMSGGSIHSLLQRFGPFNEGLIARYTRQIVLGLQYLHSQHVAHRDIKGANVLVDSDGTVRLADFGASKELEEVNEATVGAKSIQGTPFWMAPEVIRQSGHGRKADIWSVGCTVIEMATARPPWSHFKNPVAAMFQIASGEHPLPIPAGLSDNCADFVRQCMQQDPAARPSASELLQHPFLVSTASPQLFSRHFAAAAAAAAADQIGQSSSRHRHYADIEHRHPVVRSLQTPSPGSYAHAADVEPVPSPGHTAQAVGARAQSTAPLPLVRSASDGVLIRHAAACCINAGSAACSCRHPVHAAAPPYLPTRIGVGAGPSSRVPVGSGDTAHRGDNLPVANRLPAASTPASSDQSPQLETVLQSALPADSSSGDDHHPTAHHAARTSQTALGPHTPVRLGVQSPASALASVPVPPVASGPTSVAVIASSAGTASPSSEPAGAAAAGGNPNREVTIALSDGSVLHVPEHLLTSLYSVFAARTPAAPHPMGSTAAVAAPPVSAHPSTPTRGAIFSAQLDVDTAAAAHAVSTPSRLGATVESAAPSSPPPSISIPAREATAPIRPSPAQSQSSQQSGVSGALPASVTGSATHAPSQGQRINDLNSRAPASYASSSAAAAQTAPSGSDVRSLGFSDAAMLPQGRWSAAILHTADSSPESQERFVQRAGAIGGSSHIPPAGDVVIIRAGDVSSNPAAPPAVVTAGATPGVHSWAGSSVSLGSASQPYSYHAGDAGIDQPQGDAYTSGSGMDDLTDDTVHTDSGLASAVPSVDSLTADAIRLVADDPPSLGPAVGDSLPRNLLLGGSGAIEGQPRQVNSLSVRPVAAVSSPITAVASGRDAAMGREESPAPQGPQDYGHWKPQ